jgi:hypothetical protein
MPVTVPLASAEAYVRTLFGSREETMAGPVGIVREVARAKTPTALALIGAVGAYYFPLFVFIALIAFPRTARRK